MVIFLEYIHYYVDSNQNRDNRNGIIKNKQHIKSTCHRELYYIYLQPFL